MARAQVDTCYTVASNWHAINIMNRNSAALISTGGRMGSPASELRDGMRIEWDVPIPMDDGLTLRADVFSPPEPGLYPVILSYGPYGKGLAYQEGYPSAWQRMVTEHPDVAHGSTNRYQSWEVVDPERWVPDRYVCLRLAQRGG